MAQAQQKLGQPVNRRLGDLLVADGLLTPAQLQKALGAQRGSTEKLGSVLIKLGFINEEQLIGFLSRQYGVPSITLAQLEIDPGVDLELGKRDGGHTVLAREEPDQLFLVDEAELDENGAELL